MPGIITDGIPLFTGTLTGNERLVVDTYLAAGLSPQSAAITLTQIAQLAGGGLETGVIIIAGGTYNVASVTPGAPVNYIIATTSSVILNIPSPNSIRPFGRINVTDQSGNPNVTVTPATGLINGQANQPINTAYGSSDFLDFGTGWAIQ